MTDVEKPVDSPSTPPAGYSLRQPVVVEPIVLFAALLVALLMFVASLLWGR